MQRSRTEVEGPGSRLRAGSGGASEDELPSREIGRSVHAFSPMASTVSLKGARPSPSVSSFADDLAPPSEVGSEDLAMGSPSPTAGHGGGLLEVEEAEDWGRTKAARRVSLIDYDSLALATLREGSSG